MDTSATRTALITGGTAGLGLALTRALVAAGWTVVTDGRRAERADDLPDGVRFLPGDITDPDHRAELVAEVARLGRLDLLVDNASTLGPVPMGPLAEASTEDLDHLTLTFGAETGLTTWAVDPGDMRTAMHQDAFVGEDISDRPEPETVVPHLIHLIEARPGSGRYLARELS